MKTRYVKWHETCKCSVNLEKMFVIINNIGTKINADVKIVSAEKN